MSTHREERAYLPSGFFVLRTPLLPFEDFSSWSARLHAPDCCADPERLRNAVETDRAALRRRLRAFVARPEVREALFVGSPDFDEALERWLCDPESQRGQRVERSLARYVARMAGRPTPFGLFAGYSVGTVGGKTRLTVEGRSAYRRHTRLDFGYLNALSEALGRDSTLERVMTYRPNSTLYRVAGRVHYVEIRFEREERSHHLVAVDDGPELQATLARAAEGATLPTLAAALVTEDIALAAAEAYVAELVASQVLVPELPVPVTGREAALALEDALRAYPGAAPVADRLEDTRAELAAIDAGGLGVDPARYRAVADTLRALPVKVTMSRLLKVDLVKPAPRATLGRSVIEEIGRGVEILHRLYRPPATDALPRFREAFISRYGERAVPLVEALDGEIGIGFAGAGLTRTAEPLLEDLALPAPPESTVAWGARDRLLLGKLSDALARGAHEIVLEERDIDEIASADAPPLPDAFAAMATVAAPSEGALDRGDFRILLRAFEGPSGTRLLGRFCQADDALCRHVERQLRAEEAFDPDAVFAEVVHLADGGLGNILARPVLRAYEIAYLGCSGAPPVRQIPITDLLVSVEGERIVLRSRRLGRRVIPRLTSAHDYARRGLPTYRFLCMLQTQGVHGSGEWSWGPLESARFLPRVRVGRLVLCLARWRVSKEEIRQLVRHRGAELFAAVQRWRAERRLSRLVGLADGDGALPVDFDNVLSVETLVHMIKERPETVLEELFPARDELCVTGPEGHFAHELVVPFIRTRASSEAMAVVGSSVTSASAAPLPSGAARRFAPGSEWLYVKLYTGVAAADRLLHDVVGPLARHGLARGWTKRWFFIRYADPDWHLRVRFHGDPVVLREKMLPAFESAVAPLLDDGRVWRVQIDSYEREVERYGGPDGVELSEQIFQIDSEAALDLVGLFAARAVRPADRWRLALRGVDLLLTELGLDLAGKRALVTELRDGFAKELGIDATRKRQLAERFRREREGLQALLDAASDRVSGLRTGLEVLRRRSERLAPVVAELRTRERGGRLSVPIRTLAPSYTHVHLLRVLRCEQRTQEGVLYDFLARLYEARAVRARTSTAPQGIETGPPERNTLYRSGTIP